MTETNKGRSSKMSLTEEVELHFKLAQHKGARNQKISKWKYPLWRPEGFLVE